MAMVRIANGVIPKVVQEITVNGSRERDMWCPGIAYSAGIGTTNAQLLLPYSYADEIGSRYADKKVIIKAGMGSASKTLFIGYISSKEEEISDSEDGVSLTAYSAGHYLDKIGIGEDLNHHKYKYPLFDEVTGLQTGWTPAGVLLDIFARLPQRWKDELALGNITAITDSYDLPVQSYEFSLAGYRDAIEQIAASLGDIVISERFHQDKCYLDFHRIASANAPRSSVRVADWDEANDANVAKITPNETSDELINKSIAFGQDKLFMITCKSIVASLETQSEINPGTALQKDWDTAFEAIVLSDPKLAGEDKINRSVTLKSHLYADGTADGSGGEGLNKTGQYGGATSFYGKVDIPLIPNKTILIDPKSRERMLVTSFTPGAAPVTGTEEDEDGTPEKFATITVTRNYQAEIGQEASLLKFESNLTIEIPGISNVFRRYRLPNALRTFPKKEIQSDLPIIDPETNERVESQIFIYRSNLAPDNVDTKKRTGTINTKPSLMQGGNCEFEKFRIMLDEPALQPVTSQKVTENGKDKIKTTYQETVVGCTFAYIDPFYPFGWWAIQESEMDLPWQLHTERVKLDDFQYWQATNENWPIVDPWGVEHVFGCQYINPKTDEVASGPAVLRDDTQYLKTAAERILMEKCRKHVSYAIEIPWLDLGYSMGNRLDIQGLRNQPKELLTITQVSFDMPVEGGSNTSLTVDNIRPPARQRFNTKYKKSM